MRRTVKTKYDYHKEKKQATTDCYIRISSEGVWCSAKVREIIKEWQKVNYSFDDKKRLIFIERDDLNGLYKISRNRSTSKKYTVINGIAVFHKLGVCDGVRIPVEARENELIINYSNFMNE
jgi:hypothetical protein